MTPLPINHDDPDTPYSPDQTETCNICGASEDCPQCADAFAEHDLKDCQEVRRPLSWWLYHVYWSLTVSRVARQMRSDRQPEQLARQLLRRVASPPSAAVGGDRRFHRSVVRVPAPALIEALTKAREEQP